MKSRAFIFNDFDLDFLLSKRRNLISSKKSLITYFITLPRLNDIIDIIFLPESLLDDEAFINSIITFLFNNHIKTGISFNTKFIKQEEETPISQDYAENPLPKIQHYCEKYSLSHVHIQLPFGKRRIQKSPKHEEYSAHSQYSWINVSLILQWITKTNRELWLEPNLYFFENSSEDFYIHMRQIFWEGMDTFKKMGFKFNQMKLIVQPFYPKLRGLRDADILDPGNIANTTLRCMTECLTKERMDVCVRPCKEFSIYSYVKYLKFMKTYGKEITLDYILTSDILKEYLKIWDFNEQNLEEAQKLFKNELTRENLS